MRSRISGSAERRKRIEIYCTYHGICRRKGRASMDLRNYQDSDYEEYRTMYNGCFRAMRMALELQPAECCAGREELERRRSEIWILEISGTLAGSVAVYGNEIDDLVVKEEFQGQGLGRGSFTVGPGPSGERGLRPRSPPRGDWNRRAMELYRGRILHHKDRSDRQNRLRAI